MRWTWMPWTQFQEWGGPKVKAGEWTAEKEEWEERGYILSKSTDSILGT